MYHAKTPSHKKNVILKCMLDENGVVRVVFCTVARGMGVNFAGLNYILHYGALIIIRNVVKLDEQENRQNLLSTGHLQIFR